MIQDGDEEMNDYRIRQINSYKWEVEMDASRGMRVPGIIFSDQELLEHARRENTISQVANVATLPGIVKASFAMPDIHFGYGFPIGGVAAFDPEDGGVISPGGVGFDISCGVRALRSNLSLEDTKDDMENIMSIISYSVPRGLGGKGSTHLSGKDLERILSGGVKHALKMGYGMAGDEGFIEDNGRMEGADPAYVSQTAKKRGSGQLGTLGSGNHFLEIQAVDEVYDEDAADAFGLFKGQIIIMVHSGSRGLGHQVCSDYIKVMQKASDRYKIHISDRQLAAAPLDSPEGKRYYGAMACAANFAMANRHCLAHRVRQALERHMGSSAEKLGLYTLYDISHNIARWEIHEVNGSKKRLCVHRKGATRAFGPGGSHLPQGYMHIGQPVIIPGDMGTYSFILAGTEMAMTQSFGSTCHGAGRMMSRTRAKKTINGSQLKLDLERKKGIVVVADSLKGLAEEAPQAYKDIESVVNISTMAGLSRKVARLRPLGVIKG